MVVGVSCLGAFFLTCVVCVVSVFCVAFCFAFRLFFVVVYVSGCLCVCLGCVGIVLN